MAAILLTAAGVFAGLSLGGGHGAEGSASGAQSKAGAAATGAVERAPQSEKDEPAETRGRLGSGRSVTLAFGGDVHFEGIVRSRLDAGWGLPLGPIAPVLKRADLAMVNLETTVSTRGAPIPGKAYTFRAPPVAFRALKSGGVDVATIANNHGVDYGMVSFLDTLKYARRYKVPLVGGGANSARAYAPYRVTIKGQRIAILGASQVIDSNLISSWTAGPGKPGLASAYDVGRLTRAVKAARKSADTVVVYLHYGEERNPCPTGIQSTLARRMVAAGADVVVGSHAHRQQGAGRLGRAFVAYGLGNFVWYSQNSAASVTTGVLKVKVTGRRIDGYVWVPARITNGSPTPLGGSARSAAISTFRGLRSCTDLEP